MLKISRESEINLINVLIDNDVISGKDLISIKKNSDLNHAREIALLNFPEIKAKYHPHLSLAYGNIDLKIKKSLKKKIQCPFKHFNVKELYLAHNDEINFKWEVIDKFNLAQ